MRDIFLGEKGSLMANWLQACPDAEHCLDFSLLPAQIQEPLFWIHMDGGRLEWALTMLEQLRQRFGAVRAIVLANAPDQGEALRLFAQGASGYCHSYTSPQALAEIRLVVSHGGVWLGQDVLQRLIAQGRSMTGSTPERVNSLLSQLTAREQEVALKAAEGMSNKEIALQLHITERTVKAHLTSIFEQLNIRDRLQLALMLNQRPY